MLIMVFSSEEYNFLKKSLSGNGFLKKFGLYSFGIYLWHLNIIDIYRQNTHFKVTDEKVLLVIFVSFYVGKLFFVLGKVKFRSDFPISPFPYFIINYDFITIYKFIF